jgi:hypothetical protein
MRPSRCSAGLLALLALVPARLAVAQAVATAEGGAFLLLPVGARATALGQAAAADAGSTEALFWNPAGLAGLTRGELALHHYSAFFGNGDAVVLAVPSAAVGTFAVSAYVVDYGDFELTVGGPDGGPDPIGRFTARNVALAASYATDVVAGISAGLAYKLVQFRIDCTGQCANIPSPTGTTHAVDVGFQLALPTAAPIVIGAAVRNVGFKLQVTNRAQADPLPTRVQVGASMGLVRPVPGTERLDLRVLADLQGVVGQGSLQPVTLFGAESGVGERVRLRAGYAFVEGLARGPSLGLGVRFGSLALDLARVFYDANGLGEQEPAHLSFRVIF